MIPSPQYVQAWTNQIRSVSALTPAQLQVIARNNQVAYQQLLRQQVMFQQALMRNPQAMLQVQSLWMAQLHMLHKQQQQQQAMAAASLEVPSAGTISSEGNNVSLPGEMSASTPQMIKTQTSKLLGTMSNSGSAGTTESLTVSSGNFPDSSFCKANVAQTDNVGKVNSKPPRQNTGNVARVASVPATSTRIASGGKNAGISRSSAHVANGPTGPQLSNSNSSKSDARNHSSKSSRNLTKNKVSVTHSSLVQTSSGDKRSKQKSSK